MKAASNSRLTAIRVKPLVKHSHLLIFSTAVLWVLWSIPNTTTAAEINVPAGDSGALLTAISEANESVDPTVIHLTGGGGYLLDLSSAAPESISTPIIIQGNGAHLVGTGNESYGPLFEVLESGMLELSDMTIRDFRGSAGLSVQDGGLISNRGFLLGRNLRIEHIQVQANGLALSGVFVNRNWLELTQVRIVDITVNSSDAHFVRIALYNMGEARLQNVLIVDGKGGDPEMAGSPGAYIENVGHSTLDMRFSSLILQSKPSEAAPDFLAVLDHSAGFVVTPETRVSGSMIVGMECGFLEPATSGGYNLFTSPSCDLSGSNDLVGVSPGKLQFLVGLDGGIEIKLPPNSRALDRVGSSTLACPASDAVGNFRPQDGNHDGIARCDIGAFENDAGSPLLSGGANGLFYSAGYDGHYVTIQEVRPDEYVIFWNTFDLNGNQAWIIALGERKADVISAQGYFLPNGVLMPGAGADVDTSQLQEWGTVEIDLANCLEGAFAYASELPQFGSGSFDLDRLAFVEGLGCQSE
jgi:hypothetical protein